MVKRAMFYEKLGKNIVCCSLCAHRCKIQPLAFGLCGVRQNIKGDLKTLVYGKPAALSVDPIEKKPLYHFLPKSLSYSIATRGCNFKCDFCQNWQISQNSEKVKKDDIHFLTPEDIVKEAKAQKCKSISYTYTEPTIFFEYAYDIAKLAKEDGLKNVFVTNGYMTKEALLSISPYLDAANVDLKAFSEEFYAKVCKARLKQVLDSIKFMKELNIWIEITTLVIPGQNDSQSQLEAIAKFIASVDREIPWHISRFHPSYKFLEYGPTSIEILKKAYEIGKKCGLRYVYLGNTKERQDTYCYNCGEVLVKRDYFEIFKNNIKDSKCSFCDALIDGFFQ